MAFGFPARFTERRTFNLAEDELFAVVRSAFENLGWLAYEIRQGKEFHKWLHNSPMTWGEEFTVKFLPGGIIEIESRCTSGGWRSLRKFLISARIGKTSKHFSRKLSER